MKHRVATFLERMTRREKMLVATLLGTAVVLTLGLGTAVAVTPDTW